MSKQKLIINLGLARCGTTATEDYFRQLSGFSTPTGIKELKFFLRDRSPDSYQGHFDNSQGAILFESSPPYMHNGLEVFSKVIERINNLERHGFEVHLLINIRNLLKRAFSHYWHDINGHYSIFGKYWKISDPDDPSRLSNLYTRSFIEELSKEETAQKFLPEVSQMIDHAISVMGKDRVRLIFTSNLDRGIDAFLSEIAPERTFPKTETRPIPGTRAPVYLYGGERGATFSAASHDGPEEVFVPAHCCVLFARRHEELLHGSKYDLARITAAANKWTKFLKTDTLPDNVTAYLADQRALMTTLPAECFLTDDKQTALDEVFEVPSTLSIKSTEPIASVVRELVWQRQINDAERDGKVMVGRGGRLFLHHDMNSVMAQHSGALILSDEQVHSWSATLDARTRSCAAAGLRYEMVFAPDTHAVYREDIPLLDSIENVRPIQQIIADYTGNNLHYPLEEMREARKFGEVCQFTDSHWSAFGAFVAYRALIQKIGLNVPVPDEEDYKLQDKSLVGDLGLKFDPPRSGRTTEVIFTQHSRKVWNNSVNNRGHMSLWVGSKRNLPKALLLTDSYGWKFQTFLAQSFSDLFVVHSPIFEKEAVERFKPDVVISLLAERFAYKVPNDMADKTAIQHAIEKIPGSAYPDFGNFDL